MGLVAVAMGLGLFLLWRNQQTPKDVTTSNPALHGSNQALLATAIEPLQTTNASDLQGTIGQLTMQAKGAFSKVMERLHPYGMEAQGKVETGAQLRTNRAGGIKIEVGVWTDKYYASFVAGPLDSTGKHTNPFLPPGALLTQMHSLRDGSDTRRDPDAMNTWHRSTGVWTEHDAVTETFRLMEQMGMPTNQVVKYRYYGTPITVNTPSGDKARVTPFHQVQMSKYANDDYSSFLNVEYRIDDKPPGRVTRWWSWPPIQVP